jgi:hypothetical protein
MEATVIISQMAGVDRFLGTEKTLGRLDPTQVGLPTISQAVQGRETMCPFQTLPNLLLFQWAISTAD